MKTLSLLAVFGMFATSAFAQDDYTGKCQTHSDYQGKLFTIEKTLVKTVEPAAMSVSEVQALIQKVGPALFTKVMKIFFQSVEPIKEKTMAKSFIDYCDDFTEQQIILKSNPSMNLIRFNVGYGGGNGGFVTFQINENGTFNLVSQEEDTDLVYCSRKVWKN